MAFTRMLLLLALVGCAAAAASPTFTPLKNSGYPGAFLSGLWVADQLPGSFQANNTFLSTLTFTDAPTQLAASTFDPDQEVAEGEAPPPASSFLRHNITSWECAPAEEWAGEPGMEGALYVLTKGVLTYGDGVSEPAAELCWVLAPAKDGKSLKQIASRAIDSQSSAAGAYDPACPGRLHGGQLMFPTVYNKVETKSFPAAANPCIKGKASRKLI